MAKYLVTGTAGFIGSQVARQLLEQNHSVVGIDNLNDAYDVSLKLWRLDQLKKFSNFEFHKIDISDRNELSDFFTKSSPFEAIINLAARAGVPVSVQNPWIYVDTNTTGTLNLLDACQKYGIEKFILASTSSLYGTHNKLPYTELANTDEPLSPYAASKKGAEALAYSYHHIYGLDVTVFRYFTVYGPAGRPDMSIFRFAHWIIEGEPVEVTGDGSQSRDFTYVGDIARGTILGLKKVGYQIVNLGSDAPYSINEMIQLLEEKSGKKAKLTFLPTPHTDMSATWADIKKAKDLLNWQPKISFSDGLQALVDWYMQERSWASKIEIPKLF